MKNEGRGLSCDMMSVRAVVVVVVVMVVMVVVVVDCERREHRTKNERPRRQDKTTVNVPHEFLEWHEYNERFLAHISTPPSQLSHQELKPHLNTLLVDLDFLPNVSRYVDEHLNHVSTAEQARRVFTLLDLYSAQEPLRQRYIMQMRRALVELFEAYPEFSKQTIPVKFVLDGFDRHVKKMKKQTVDLYRRVLVAAPSNLNLLPYYWPGRHPSLDQALTRYSLPPPFLTMDEVQWFQIRLADPPHLTLSLDLLTWRLLLVNNTFSPTLFRFEPVQVSFGAERYLLRSAVLSSEACLSYPCQQHILCFDYENEAKVEVLGLPDGEAALIHKQGGHILFLQHSKGGKINAKVPEPSMTRGYPGRGAHWVILPFPDHAST